jgi:hypothetical protein
LTSEGHRYTLRRMCREESAVHPSIVGLEKLL